MLWVATSHALPSPVRPCAVIKTKAGSSEQAREVLALWWEQGLVAVNRRRPLPSKVLALGITTMLAAREAAHGNQKYHVMDRLIRGR